MPSWGATAEWNWIQMSVSIVATTTHPAPRNRAAPRRPLTAATQLPSPAAAAATAQLIRPASFRIPLNHGCPPR